MQPIFVLGTCVRQIHVKIHNVTCPTIAHLYDESVMITAVEQENSTCPVYVMSGNSFNVLQIHFVNITKAEWWILWMKPILVSIKCTNASVVILSIAVCDLYFPESNTNNNIADSIFNHFRAFIGPMFMEWLGLVYCMLLRYISTSSAVFCISKKKWLVPQRHLNVTRAADNLTYLYLHTFASNSFVTSIFEMKLEDFPGTLFEGLNARTNYLGHG